MYKRCLDSDAKYYVLQVLCVFMSVATQARPHAVPTSSQLEMGWNVFKSRSSFVAKGCATELAFPWAEKLLQYNSMFHVVFLNECFRILGEVLLGYTNTKSHMYPYQSAVLILRFRTCMLVVGQDSYCWALGYASAPVSDMHPYQSVDYSSVFAYV